MDEYLNLSTNEGFITFIVLLLVIVFGTLLLPIIFEYEGQQRRDNHVRELRHIIDTHFEESRQGMDRFYGESRHEMDSTLQETRKEMDRSLQKTRQEMDRSFEETRRTLNRFYKKQSFTSHEAKHPTRTFQASPPAATREGQYIYDYTHQANTCTRQCSFESGGQDNLSVNTHITVVRPKPKQGIVQPPNINEPFKRKT